ncbi:MAG: ferric reductase-like transmembrane domain-containing protein [Chloroflexi bacterium]|uniref:Ferric reductase-like transmembrane domain-containing protein n=1 Tax=Candidatus Chlorohelix allophototropha TaxID=3003348 RepID=A0A8T7M9J5_9CHLR|nr:ferric reductase-like transmembrane domain-containing protein [Chloroflexota bacterium]WJW68542.1 Rieske 2Fe-2S domain-containing protein [Chloroflexota bacterium L227-S17]
MARFGKTRYMSHAGLALFTVLSCYVAFLLEGAAPLNVVLTDGLGYCALILLVATLAIGPLNLLRKRKNPVNLNLRRDFGIWMGLTALVHVLISFQLYSNNGVLYYFFENGVPQINTFGFANYTGLLATLITVVLLVFSNNRSLKYLKGKRWKAIQRFNYPLFGLTALHTLGYLIFNERATTLYLVLIGLVAVTLLAQGVGIVIFMARDRSRAGLYGAPVPVEAKGDVMRRRFVVVMGAAVLAGFGGGMVLRPLLFKENSQTAVADLTPEVTTTAPATTAPVRGNGRDGGLRGTQPVPGSNQTQRAQTQAPAAATTTAQANAQAKTTTPAAVSGGTVLATLASLPVGTVQQFTTPDTHKRAFVTRTADGSVKAFSGICTHRPFDLVYNQGLKQLYCSLHGACFDPATGAATRSPGRIALPALKVQVDGQGNIVYTSL